MRGPTNLLPVPKVEGLAIATGGHVVDGESGAEGRRSAPLGRHHDVVARLVPKVVPERYRLGQSKTKTKSQWNYNSGLKLNFLTWKHPYLMESFVLALTDDWSPMRWTKVMPTAMKRQSPLRNSMIKNHRPKGSRRTWSDQVPLTAKVSPSRRTKWPLARPSASPMVDTMTCPSARQCIVCGAPTSSSCSCCGSTVECSTGARASDTSTA